MKRYDSPGGLAWSVTSGGRMALAGSSARKWLLQFVRLAVTVAAIAYVIGQVQWKDRLVEAGQPPRWGWIEYRDQGRPLFHESNGAVIPLPENVETIRADTPGALSVVPGLITLLKGVDPWLMLLAVVGLPLGVFPLTLRWQWLLRTHGLDPGYLETLRLTLIGQFTNNVLPGSTGGDLVKGVCIYRRAQGKRMAAVMTVFIDRVVGLISLMLVGAVSILMQAHRSELEGPAQLVQWVLLVIFVGSALFFSRRIRNLLRIGDLLDKLPFNEHLRRVDDSLFHYRHHLGTVVKTVAISLVVHIYTLSVVYLLGRSLGLDVEYVSYLVFLPVIFTVGAVVPAIAGLGVLEGLFQKFFSLPGIGATPSSAVALCVLFRITTLVASLPGALPTYRELKRKPTPGERAAVEEAAELAHESTADLELIPGPAELRTAC